MTSKQKLQHVQNKEYKKKLKFKVIKTKNDQFVINLVEIKISEVLTLVLGQLQQSEGLGFFISLRQRRMEKRVYDKVILVHINVQILFHYIWLHHKCISVSS